MRVALLAMVLAVPAVAAHGSVGPEVHVVLTDEGFAFEPFEYTVSTGLTVAWTDDTGAPHTVTRVASPRSREPDGGFNETLAPRSTVFVDVGPPGDVFYVCLLHDMIGVLHVVAATPATPLALFAAALGVTLLSRRPRCRS
ncbi:MAG TPA: hypothetical protein VI997_01495 [Candidatus Thermoplasmatota archaeon]|nr:hypothetical protein [Candidatus Thermoplasmatota archaeon]